MNRKVHIISKIYSALSMILIVFFFSNCASKMETAHRRALFSGSNAIIVDHTCTELSDIPDYWIQKAKELTLHYAHTSHGKQIVSGANFLARQDPKYAFVARYTDADHPGLPSGRRCCSDVSHVWFPNFVLEIFLQIGRLYQNRSGYRYIQFLHVFMVRSAII